MSETSGTPRLILMDPLTVDEALALVEQERLDMLSVLGPDEPYYEEPPYVLASEVRKLRVELTAARQKSEGVEAMRSAVIEECAELCDKLGDEAEAAAPYFAAGAYGCRDAIRALAPQEAAKPAEQITSRPSEEA